MFEESHFIQIKFLHKDVFEFKESHDMLSENTRVCERQREGKMVHTHKIKNNNIFFKKLEKRK